MKAIAVVVVLFSACLVARAQGSLQATLTAVSPIVASGTAGASVSHPAGPLTQALVIGPAGTSAATFSCTLTSAPAAVTLTARYYVLSPLSGSAQTDADLLLQVSASSVLASVEVELWYDGDSPWYEGFQVDVGDDGVAEVNTAFSYIGSPSRRRRHLTSSLVSGPLQIRIRNRNPSLGPGSSHDYGITLRVAEWSPIASSTTPACPVIAYGWTIPGPETNYQLAVLPAPAPNVAELRAIGFGLFDAYIVSDQPAVSPLQLPLPYPGVCDVLANVLIVDPGLPSASQWGLPQANAWSLFVPPLPPGLVLYVQHLSATQGYPFWFGATNRVRIDT